MVNRQAAAISGVMAGFRRTVEGPGRHPRKQERELVIVRTSPLAKRYGWGFLFDTDGRVKLCPMESEEYRELVESGDVKVLKAMASSRR